jgi:hypothetical protein
MTSPGDCIGELQLRLRAFSCCEQDGEGPCLALLVNPPLTMRVVGHRRLH